MFRRKKNVFEDDPVFEFFFIQRIRKNILHLTLKKQVLRDCEISKVFGAIHGKSVYNLGVMLGIFPLRKEGLGHWSGKPTSEKKPICL
jgi:hypothetical protein